MWEECVHDCLVRGRGAWPMRIRFGVVRKECGSSSALLVHTRRRLLGGFGKMVWCHKASPKSHQSRQGCYARRGLELDENTFEEKWKYSNA